MKYQKLHHNLLLFTFTPITLCAQCDTIMTSELVLAITLQIH